MVQKVMLVEDSTADRNLIITLLQEDSTFEFEVIEAKDGADALRLLNGGVQPNLMILDLNMPGVRGFDVLDFVKKDDMLKKVPVIVFTSSRSEHDISTSYDKHAAAFLTKPMNLSAFESSINAIKDFWLGITHLPTFN